MTRDRQPGSLVIAVSTVRKVATVIGIAAGAVGFWGFFVHFFNGSPSALSTAPFAWFDLIPICIGLSVIALAVPRFGYMASGLALIPLGIAVGARGIDEALVSVKGRGLIITIPPGAGFWMIVIGSAVLTLMWLVILTLRLGSDSAGPALGSAGQEEEADHQAVPVD